jgi:hypothetical protein
MKSEDSHILSRIKLGGPTPPPLLAAPFGTTNPGSWSAAVIVCDISVLYHEGGGINHYRWAHLLKQQSSISVYCLLTNENKRLFLIPFAANEKKFAVSIFRMHKMIGSCCCH